MSPSSQMLVCDGDPTLLEQVARRRLERVPVAVMGDPGDMSIRRDGRPWTGEIGVWWADVLLLDRKRLGRQVRSQIFRLDKYLVFLLFLFGLHSEKKKERKKMSVAAKAGVEREKGRLTVDRAGDLKVLFGGDQGESQMRCDLRLGSAGGRKTGAVGEERRARGARDRVRRGWQCA